VKQGDSITDPLAVLYENLRNSEGINVPPMNIAALAARRAQRLTAEDMWALARADDRKGWTLMTNDTSAAGRVRPPTVATSTLGATFSFNAKISGGYLQFTAMSSYENFGKVNISWVCPTGESNSKVFDGYKAGGTSLPSRSVTGAGVRSKQTCRFTFTNLGGRHGSQVRLLSDCHAVSGTVYLFVCFYF